jgi:hypothetical protein
MWSARGLAHGAQRYPGYTRMAPSGCAFDTTPLAHAGYATAIATKSDVPHIPGMQIALTCCLHFYLVFQILKIDKPLQLTGQVTGWEGPMWEGPWLAFQRQETFGYGAARKAHPFAFPVGADPKIPAGRHSAAGQRRPGASVVRTERIG